MLGWLISVHRVVDEVSVRRSFAEPPLDDQPRARFGNDAVGKRVAIWQAGLYGLRWIEQAAGLDGAITLSRGGYPNWYLVRAADLLPTILERRPYEAPMYEYPRWIIGEDDVLLPGWLGKTTIDDDAVNACHPDEFLLVEAWDES